MPILTIFGQIFYKIFIIHSDCLLDIPTEEAIGYQMSPCAYLQVFQLKQNRRAKIGYFYKLSIYSILPVVCYGRPTMAGLTIFGPNINLGVFLSSELDFSSKNIIYLCLQAFSLKRGKKAAFPLKEFVFFSFFSQKFAIFKVFKTFPGVKKYAEYSAPTH